ncbi:hypothetical protein DXT96_05295 [Agrobacterium sp. ICMP 6402]|nr:hypothetical protein [Agrobacterium sp. ICMP 6402]
MKMGEAISTRRFRMILEGEIHIDGKYAGGHIKPENRKEDRVDRRRAENQNFKRLTILTLREKTPFRRGREQTLSRVIRSEDSDEAWEMVKKHVRKGSRLHADEHFSYDDLEGLQELHRVNHSKEYQAEGGGQHEPRRELLQPHPACLYRHPPSLLGTLLRLVRGRNRLARGQSSCRQRPSAPGHALQGALKANVEKPMRILAGQPPTRPCLGGRGEPGAPVAVTTEGPLGRRAW